MAASTLEVLITGDASSLTGALNQGATAAKQFEQVAGGAANAASQQVGSIGQTLKTLAPAFLAIGAAAVAGITKGISATQDWASETRTLQRVTGQTTEEASTLLASANLLGIGVSDLTIGFGSLSKSIVNGAPNLERYGIEVRDTTGQMLPFDDILGAVIDKFATLPEGPEQAAFAMNVFGRSGKALIPILAKGREGMGELAAKASELGLVMGQEGVDAAKALTASQRELGLALKGAAISLGQLFIPALTKVVQVGTQVVEFFTRLPAPVKEIGVGLALAAGAVGALTVAFTGLRSTFGPVIEGITSFGKALFESGLFETAGTALSGVSSAVTVVGNSVQTAEQQIQAGSDSASEGLTVVADAATVAATAAQASAVKTASSAGAFESFGAKAAGALSKIGPAIAGVGASIAAAAPEILIIVGIAAAIATVAILVIKNWDKIKAALKPGLDAIGAAFGELKAAFGSVMSALGEAFRAVSEAVAPLLPALKTLLGIWLKLAAAQVIGVILIFLKSFAIQMKVLAFAVDQGAKGIKQLADFFGPILAFAIQHAVDGINFFIDGINRVIGGINNLIKFSNLVLGTNFELIGSIDHVGQAATGAAADVSGLGDDVAALGGAADDAVTGFKGLASSLKAAAPLFDAMGTSASDFKDEAVAAATTAANAIATGAAEGADAFQVFADKAIESAIQARDAFKDSMRSALTFSTSMLSELQSVAQQAQEALAGDTSEIDTGQLAILRDQANITAQDILETFRSATIQTKNFGRDLLELSKIGGKAGKDLATSLAESGNVLAAQVIADAPAKLQGQIVHAFGQSEKAADRFSTKLTNAIVGPLDDIKRILLAIAKSWGISVDLKDHASNGIDNISNKLGELTRHEYNVILHLKGGSPLPDEALKTHLTDPLNSIGFKQIAGRWTLPLDVTAHTALDDVAPPDSRTGGGSGPGIHKLIAVEVDNRGILKDIRRVLKHMDDVTARGGGHAGGGGGGGGGPTGGATSVTSALKDAAASVVQMTSKAGGTLAEGVGVVKRVARAGSDAAFIKQAVADVRAELGKDAAKRYAEALRLLDARTIHNDAKRAAAIHAALRAEAAMQQGPLVSASKDQLSPWYEYALSNAPRLPAGHTRIDPNLHNRDLRVRVDIGRERMDREGAYQAVYSGYDD